MSSTLVDKTATYLDERVSAGVLVKTFARKVFPDHWSFMLGEICLYTFVILVVSGTFLTLWYVPSMGLTTYTGEYAPMAGQTVSDAYNSTLNLSFEVRGGLLMRQIHHWAALLFVAAILAHMARVFVTGAFRKPREFNWVLGRHPGRAGPGGRLHRLLPARRPALGQRSADHPGRHPGHPDRGHVPLVLHLRRAVPRRGHHPAPVHQPRDDHPGAAHRD